MTEPSAAHRVHDAITRRLSELRGDPELGADADFFDAILTAALSMRTRGAGAGEAIQAVMRARDEFAPPPRPEEHVARETVPAPPDEPHGRSLAEVDADASSRRRLDARRPR